MRYIYIYNMYMYQELIIMCVFLYAIMYREEVTEYFKVYDVIF